MKTPKAIRDALDILVTTMATTNTLSAEARVTTDGGVFLLSLELVAPAEEPRDG